MTKIAFSGHIAVQSPHPMHSLIPWVFILETLFLIISPSAIIIILVGTLSFLILVLSIPGNIAEGIERKSDKETLNFSSYAKGSCGELRTQSYIGMKIGYVSKDKGNQWITETKEISAMLIGLMNSINTK